MSTEKEWLHSTGPGARRSHRLDTADSAAMDRPRSAPASPIQRLRDIARRAGNRLVRRYAEEQAFTAPERVERTLDAEAGHGAPLEHGARQQMESAFGADFSSVRIHADSQADGLNSELSARAFTRGQDVYFSSGEYAPGTSAGQRLLAHELAHVEQQSDGAKLEVGAANDPAELEADAMADQAVQRLSAGANNDRDMARRQEEEEDEEELAQPMRRTYEDSEELA